MTTDDGRCPVTELPKDGCAHCRPAPARPDPADDEGYGPRDGYGPAIPAAYGGACADEGDRIDVGDLIRAHPDGGWSHVGCTS